MFVTSGKDRVERPALLEGCPRRRIADPGQRLVALDRRHEMSGFVPDVADVRRHGVGQQALDKHVPLLGELRAKVRVPGAHLAGRHIARNQIEEAGRQRAGPGGEVVRHIRLEEERRVERQPQVGASALHVLRDAVGTAHHPALGRPPGHAEAWLEALLVPLVEGAALAIAILSENLPAGGQVEVALAVVLLDHRLRVGPAHPEIQGQRGGCLEVVLHEQRDAVVEVGPRRSRTAPPFRSYLIEQEVRERGAAEGAASSRIKPSRPLLPA